MTVDQNKLHSTTDAQVWAQEFMREFGNRKDDIDEGLMIGWFANAIETAKLLGPIVGGFAEADLKYRQLREKVWAALDELGVPTPHYPAPVVNAVDILREAVG